MKKIFFIFILTALISCDNKSKNENKKKWVYIEIGSLNDFDNDAKYGEISINHLNLIQDNENGDKIIMISNARYNDEKELIVKEVAEDGNQNGTFFYKIKNINYIEILKEDPINRKVKLMDEKEK